LLNPPPLRIDKIPAVCIPPGARLRMNSIPRELQKELGVGRTEEVTFVELSASAYRYRDGVRFENGRERRGAIAGRLRAARGGARVGHRSVGRAGSLLHGLLQLVASRSARSVARRYGPRPAPHVS
jgi:hypothetical protein